MSDIAELLGMTQEQFNARCASIPFELWDYQKPWAMEVLEILTYHRCYMDTTRTRDGKSYVALWIAAFFGCKVVIVAPKGSFPDWEEVVKLAGVECAGYITYASLRGTDEHGINHKFLERSTVDDKVVFRDTPAWRRLVKNGVMLIIDELQNMKNDSEQNRAGSALIRTILDQPKDSCYSRFALLSATQFEEDRTSNILRMMGFIDQEKLYHTNPSTKEVTLYGLADLIRYCREMDEETTDRIHKKILSTPLTKDLAEAFAAELFVEVVKKEILGAMVSPPNTIGSMRVVNGFFRVGKEARKRLNSLFSKLKEALKYDESEQTVTMSGQSHGLLTETRAKIDLTIVPAMADVTRRTLATHPNMKVVLGVNFNEPAQRLCKLLAEYKCREISGETSLTHRTQYIKLFNNDPTYRVIIIKPTLSVGISLFVNNQTDQPRVLLLTPSYSPTDLTQCAGRIYGPRMHSKAEVKVFYTQGEKEPIEEGQLMTAILKSVKKKSEGMKKFLDEKVLNHTILPCDYETEIEPESDHDYDKAEEGYDWGDQLAEEAIVKAD